MTKERKLAIEMWKGIRERIKTSSWIDYSSIFDYKLLFCKSHNLNWKDQCWFCQYIRRHYPFCSFGFVKCPIANKSGGFCGCGGKSLYHTVCAAWLPKFKRIQACNKIIKALGGKP